MVVAVMEVVVVDGAGEVVVTCSVVGVVVGMPVVPVVAPSSRSNNSGTAMAAAMTMTAAIAMPTQSPVRFLLGAGAEPWGKGGG